MNNQARDFLLIELKDTILNLRKTIESLNETIANQQKSLEEKEEKNAKLQEQVDFLTKKLFGKSSEKKPFPGQYSFFESFDEAENTADPNASEPFDSEEDTTEVKAHRRKTKKRIKEKYENLPVVKRVIDLPDDQKFCLECNAPLVKVGETFVRRQLEIIPAKIQLVEIYETTYKCEACEINPEKEATPFVKARPIEGLFPHSPASESVVAFIIYNKYVLGLPLYRQEKDWLLQDVEISRATMANWIIMAAEKYLKPLYDLLHKLLLERKFLMADETRFQVLKEQDRDPTSISFIWVFRSGEDGEPQIIIYHYSPSRARAVAADFLAGFEGYLMCDGYSGYNDLPGVIRCACFAHIRRDFLDAVPKSKVNDKSLTAVQGVEYCDKLFYLEKQAKDKGLAGDELKEYRLKKEEPVIDAFIEWIKSQHSTKGTRLYKALTYATERIPLMKNYLEDGRCSLSNNLTENSVRPVTVGRKNWLFADTVKGAESSVICYTMVEIAKANSLNPLKYIQYILSQRPQSHWSEEQLSKLLPWEPVVKEICHK